MNFAGMRVLIMGLGLHGGGLASAVFLGRRGAQLTVTDLRDEETLRPSIEQLDEALCVCGAAPARYILGRHELDDFQSADMVIKNPAVPPHSPYLKAAACIETDISLFLKNNPARLIAVTGSKGKSFSAKALHHVLSEYHTETGLGRSAYLGGNITVSPLTFLDALTAKDDVVLELSSWQLGDLPAGLLRPRIALITAIMPDHLDRYQTMERYISDKKRVYQGQDEDALTVIHDGPWAPLFQRETRARTALYGMAEPQGAGGWYDAARGIGSVKGPLAGLGAEERVELLGADCTLLGAHQKTNLLGAGAALLDAGVPVSFLRKSLARFPGLEHRLELLGEKDGIRFYNDSAATIPEAVFAACQALGAPVLITGGTDKALDITALAHAAAAAKKVILLAGTASDKLCPLLGAAGISYAGPYNRLDAAFDEALAAADTGDTVILSPGCASFGMFLNEFDRGRKWKELVLAWGAVRHDKP